MTELTGEIKKTIIIDASPDVVFNALTDEKELTNWFPDQAKLEPRVGGSMQFKFFEEGKENHRVEGKVLELVQGRRISYSWANLSDSNFPKTVVTWTIEPAAGNKTLVTLVHTGFDPKSRWFDLHSKGWSYFVEERLPKYCSGIPPGKREKIK